MLSSWRLERKLCWTKCWSCHLISDKRKKCMKATIKQIYGTLRWTFFDFMENSNAWLYLKHRHRYYRTKPSKIRLFFFVIKWNLRCCLLYFGAFIKIKMKLKVGNGMYLHDKVCFKTTDFQQLTIDIICGL